MAHRGFRPGRYIPPKHSFKPETFDSDELKKEYAENVQGFRQLYHHDDELFYARKKLERSIIRLKGFREKCDAPSFLYSFLDFQWSIDELAKPTARQSPKTIRKIAKEVLDRSDRMDDTLPFNDYCHCERKDGKEIPLYPDDMEKKKSALADILFALPVIWKKDEHVLNASIGLYVANERISHNTERCDTSEILRAINHTSEIVDEAGKIIAESNILTNAEKLELVHRVAELFKWAVDPIMKFDSICVCRHADDSSIEQEDVKELGADWKRRTLYRLGGD